MDLKASISRIRVLPRGGLAVLVCAVFCAYGVMGADARDWRDLMWERSVALREGVTLRAYALEKPRLMKAYVARIDLATPGIGFTATERADRWGEPMPDYTNSTVTICTKRETVADFMSRRRNEGRNVEVAVNASGWKPWEHPFTHTYGSLYRWATSNGVEVSHGKNPERGVFFIVRKDGVTAIRARIPVSMTNEVAIAMYGNGRILKNGMEAFPPNLPKFKSVHPRTAFGLTADKKTLVLLAVDGRQPGYSLGASYADLAALLRREGCTDAINMDGGGSTSLVIFDRTSGHPLMLNHHVDGSVRKTALNLGITFTTERSNHETKP